MRVSLNWLQHYVDIDGIHPDVLAEKITKSGIEVDGIDYIGKDCIDVVVGYVKSCAKHPNADKLNVCEVDIGTDMLQIVCGAPNIRQDVQVAVAKPGAILPGDFKIKRTTLRGVESNGMICSLQELGFSEEHIPKSKQEGIYIFPESVPVGEAVEPFLNMNDAVLDLDLTPNRADCLNMLGMAYEVSAILDIDLQLPDETVKPSLKDVNDIMKVDVIQPELCPYYSIFMVDDITVKPAPLWMQNYLLAAGIRPINNVVDITNYVLLEYGQPLHAFDYQQVNSDNIVVRPAEKGETLITLDEKERTLTSENLVITDGKQPIALAGVMGGARTEVHPDTTTILLEAALFDATTTRRTVKQTGLRSEASTRYEKGIDPGRVHGAGLRACQLLQKYANAKVHAGASVSNHIDGNTKTVKLETDAINSRLGTEITSVEIKAILTRLRFPYEENENVFMVKIPSRRGDISIFEDMLEEVARIYGYDHLPYTLPEGAAQNGGLTIKQQVKRDVNRYMQASGLLEAKTYALTDEKKVNTFLSPEIQAKDPQPIAMDNPMSADHQYLRTSILPELLQSVAYNIARNETNIGYYELGKVFITNETSITYQPEEKLRLASVLSGNWLEHLWQGETKPVDFYVVKGIVEGLFQHLNIPMNLKQEQLEGMHPGRTAVIYVDQKAVGFMGQVHPMLARNWDLNQTYVFDVDMDVCLEAYHHVADYKPIPKYPSIERDIAFIMDESMESGIIKEAIEKMAGSIVKKVHVFDVYKGENIPEGKKSVAYSLIYRDNEKTLTDVEIETSYQHIIKTINETYATYVRV